MRRKDIKPLQDAAGVTRCSVMDLGLRGMHPGLMLFYRERLDGARLERSLGKVLRDFPTYAGTLVSKGADLRIEHAGRRITLQRATSDNSLEELGAQARAGRASALNPQPSQLRLALGNADLLSARLTDARDGSVLTVAWNHVVGDMHSTMLLMRAWANAYEDLPYEKPELVLDRDAYLKAQMPDPLTARSGVSLASWGKIASYAYALARPAECINVEYSWEHLSVLQQELSGPRRVTANDAACAHLYFVLRRLAGAIEPTNLCMTVNYRKRVGIPHNVLGNLVALVAQPVDEVDEAADIAAGLRARLEQYADNYVDYQASMRVFEAHSSPGERLRIASRFFEPGRGDLLVTNWNNFGAYELKFGTSGPWLFVPLALGASKLPAWFMVVYDLPRLSGLGFAVGLPPAVAERWKKRVEPAIASRPVRAGTTTCIARTI